MVGHFVVKTSNTEFAASILSVRVTQLILQEEMNMSKATETWTEFSAEATEFVKSGAVDDDDKSVVLRMIEKGNANVKRQSRCTATVRTILMDIAGSPFARGSGLSGPASETVASVEKMLTAIAKAFDNGGAAMQGLLLPHGRSVIKDEDGNAVKDDDGNTTRKTHYANGADFAATLREQIESGAGALQKDGWNGSADGLQTIIDGGSY